MITDTPQLQEEAFASAFKKYDHDQDGQLNSGELFKALSDVSIACYAGSVSKAIRSINYKQPEKDTINYEQAKQYFLSFQSQSKQDIYKGKYALLREAGEMIEMINQGKGNSAAPGMSALKQSEKPQQMKLNCKIGPYINEYKSEVQLTIQKEEKQQTLKPFIKLLYIGSDNQNAKVVEELFKHNFDKMLELMGEEIQWQNQFKEFHLNSSVSNNTATFFFTISHQKILEIIKIFCQFLQLSFGEQISSKSHLKFQFDYDFQNFVTIANSSFYDIFTKNNKLQFQGNSTNVFKILKKAIAPGFREDQNEWDCALITPLLHLQNFESDLQFENSEKAGQMESKCQTAEGLEELKTVISQMDEGGMKINEMLKNINGNISIDVLSGDWRVKAFLKLKNWTKLLLEKVNVPSSDY